MLTLESKTFSSYYGVNPDEYYIKYIHHNVHVVDDSEEEFKRIYIIIIKILL